MFRNARNSRRFSTELQDTIRKRLEENGITAEVDGRVKRLYSIHQKSLRQHRTVDQIYDLLAVRVITDTIRNCYAALGVIHQVWRPVPGRFKDYIAMPRPNLYQSLHTTVIHSGQTFEVQIRTQEMHRIAEQGVAAHWRYKDGKDVSDADDQRILWMRQLIEWVKEMQEPSEFMSTLKVDLYPEEVYAFTPKGKVLALPRGATPVDFAYAVHTEVGNQCIGAKVNGQIVPLRHSLSNGDVVEVLTQKGHVPSRDWLNFVRTSRARSKIRHHINFDRAQPGHRSRPPLARARSAPSGPQPEENSRSGFAARGHRIRLREDRGFVRGFGLRKIFRAANYFQCAGRDAGAAQARGREGRSLDAPGLDRQAHAGRWRRDAAASAARDDLMVFRAKCCNPIPGDEIVGYVTRGRGVAVHSNSCPNVQNLLYQVERRIDVEWGGATGSTYPVTLLIRAQDRPGMLADITTVISETGSNIRTLGSHPDNLHARIDLTLEITDRKQLERIMANIRKISGVFGVERLYNI